MKNKDTLTTCSVWSPSIIFGTNLPTSSFQLFMELWPRTMKTENCSLNCAMPMKN